MKILSDGLEKPIEKSLLNMIKFILIDVQQIDNIFKT